MTLRNIVTSNVPSVSTKVYEVLQGVGKKWRMVKKAGIKYISIPLTELFTIYELVRERFLIKIILPYKSSHIKSVLERRKGEISIL